MARRHRHEGHVNHERWLVSYADFITLLFAFFVVLYASSQVDKRKVGKVALSIQVAFQQLGVFETSSTKVPRGDTEPIPFSTIQPTKGVLGPITTSAQDREIQSDLESALAPEIREHVVEVKTTREGVVVSLREVGFYESGSPTLRSSAENAFDRFAAVIQKRSESLRIEGHTDNLPIHNKQFASNWELSTARASNLIKLLINRYHVEPDRLSAAGYAEYHPAASNDTPEGRARNRRVDIVILNPPSLQQLVSAPPPAVPANPQPSNGALSKAAP